MESTRPIRALVRGLDALTTLNRRNGATYMEAALARHYDYLKTHMFHGISTLHLDFTVED